MRPLAAALTASSCLLLGGCGGSSDERSPTASADASEATVEELWRAPGDAVAVVAGTATHEVGDVRFSFLVVDREGRVVMYPSARVRVGTGLDRKPFVETTAKLERIGVPGGDEANASHLYVASVRLPDPGTYWYVAEPDGGPAVQALGDLVVEKSDPVPSPGETAPPSETPTLASTGGDLSALTTRTPPDESLLEHSVAGSLRAKIPFVVTFSTPKFCESRTCGPVVDVVEETERRFEGEDVRFIHVEVYEGNDPAKGYNRWMKEWSLETEPWTFLVGADGRIVERYEGVVSVRELEAAVREVLEQGS